MSIKPTYFRIYLEKGLGSHISFDVINISEPFNCGPNFCTESEELLGMHSNLKGRVGMLAIFPIESMFCVLWIWDSLLEWLNADWNECEDNAEYSKKERVFWLSSILYHITRYKTILKPLLISLHRTMGLKLPVFISWNGKFIKHLKEINEGASSVYAM